MQQKYEFDKETVSKIIRGALIAGTGAILTYILGLGLDFGVYTPLVTAGMAVAVNALREYGKGE